MPEVVTTIDVAAPVETCWSVLDDLESYPWWNPVVPQMAGRTTVGERLDGELVIDGMPTPPLTPRVNRVVPLREFRWISEIPGDEGFTAEHIFEFEPTHGGTRLVHREIFGGPASPMFAEPIELFIRPAYERFNQAFKGRAEELASAPTALHPAIEAGAPGQVGSDVLRCLCTEERVEVVLDEGVAHNHLCGCSKCWRPEDATFAMTAVVPADAARVSANADKLGVIDGAQAILRHACRACGTHMIGSVPDPEHHFHGLVFVHPELGERSPPPVEFAGFVSSLVESGTPLSAMHTTRARLAALGVSAHDAFSPEIMDVIAWHRRKLAGTRSTPA